MKHQARALIVLGFLTIISLFPTLTGPVVCHARQADAPLVLLINNDLWTWSEASGEPVPLTQGANVWAAVLSPDGTRLAYLAVSPLTIDARERVGGFSGYQPVDIWVIDIQTGQQALIAGQPPDAALFADETPDNAMLYSTPSWSPDGAQIAWAEVHYPSFDGATNRLMVHDLASNTTQMVTAYLPDRAYVPTPQDVIWGGGGLATLNVTAVEDGDSFGFYNAILVYDLNGNLLSELYLPDDDPDVPRPEDYTWVTQEGRDYVGILYPDGSWELVDPQTGQRQAPTGAPELYSRSAPDRSVRLTFTTDPTAEGTWRDRVWTVTRPDGQAARLDYQGTTLAVAPSGQAIAYVTPEKGVSVWRDGQVTGVTGLEAVGQVSRVFWGPTAWRVGTSQPLPAPTPVTCPGALPPRLVVGTQAQVIPNTSPNNMRDRPGTAGTTVVGQIPAGGVFTVLAGPRCAADMAWWQVNYNGTVGWTAEGDSSTYWLEPIG